MCAILQFFASGRGSAIATILIVEDEPRTAETISLFMHQQGHDCQVSHDGYAGLGLALSESFDVVILDWMLPGLDGLTICQQIRRSSSAKVILLTAKAGVNDRVYGLEQGADDYVVKPFSLRELEARVRQLTRVSRQHAQAAAPLTWALRRGSLEVDTQSYTVSYENREISLTPTELKLLAYMMERPESLLTRAQLAEGLSETGKNDVNLHNITTHLSNLRRKLHQATGDPVIKTVYGIGYRLG
ncbi:MAG: response regulator transcription factor [Bacilli bacterium]